MTLGEKIRVLRQQAGLSQSQLAQQLHVSRAAVAKWENDNGIPDVENLKALATYFNCGVDTLLDESTLANSEKNDTLHSYCCKDCVSCSEYQADRCPGCSRGPGDLNHGNCDIAACCSRFRHHNCANCTLNADCETLAKRLQMPQSSEKQKQVKSHKYETRRRDAAYLRIYVWASFWLLIPFTVQGVVGGLLQLNPCSLLKYIDIVLILLYAATNFYIFMRMSKVEASFRKTGWLMLAYSMLDILTTMFASTTWTPEILVLPTLCLAIYATYNECNSYSSMMKNFDLAISEMWQRIFKLYIISNAGAFGCLLVATVLPLLGSLLFFACCIGLIIANVLIFVCRFKSAKEISVYC